MAAGSHIIITRDNDLLRLRECRGMKIMTPDRFLAADRRFRHSTWIAFVVLACFQVEQSALRIGRHIVRSKSEPQRSLRRVVWK